MKRLFAWKSAISEAQLSVYAANAAFFLLLSLFPALALLLGLMGRFALPRTEFFEIFRHLIPKAVIPLFLDAMESLGGGTLPALSLSAITGLWSASRGIYSLLQGLRRISQDQKRRSFVWLRALAIVYTVVFLLALVLTFGLYTLGRRMLEVLAEADAPIVAVLRTILRRRGGICFVFLTGLFLLIYHTFPPHHLRLRQALPGSLVTAGGWVLFSWLFSIWVTWFTDYSKVYGSVAVVAITMLWLYFCLEIVLFGALVNESLK